MKSFFAQAYLAIQDRLTPLKAAYPDLFIEQDFGQEQFEQWRPATGFPAILIDFPECSYSHTGQSSQIAEATISIRILDAPFEQSYEGAPLETKEGAINIFELEAEICALLHGWQPELDPPICQNLMRTRAGSNNRNSIGLRIREITFTTQFDDDVQP
jgi:hypothetical protein